MPDRTSADRARRWLASGLLDLEFYAALRGHAFRDDVEAATDLVEHGMRDRLSPHPFLDFLSLPPETRRAWRQGRVGVVLEQLTGPDGVPRPVGPLAATADPRAARTRMLELAGELGRADGGARDVPRTDWRGGSPARRPDRLSVVVVAAVARPTVRTVETVLADSGIDVDVVLVDHGSPAHASLALHAAFLEREDVQVLRVPGRMSAAAATHVGLARAAGEFVLLLDPTLAPRSGGLAPLLAALVDDRVTGAQPVVLGPDDAIASAGIVVAGPGGAPVHVLAGHPWEDAWRLLGQRLAAPSPQAVALRGEDVAAVAGLREDLSREDAVLDLCARLLRRAPEGFRVVPSAAVSPPPRSDPAPMPLSPHPLLPPDPDLYRRIGFLAEAGSDAALGPVLAVTGRPPGAPDRLRWSLQLPSTAGEHGDTWGDTHFAGALARALGALDQDVVTRRRAAHGSGPTHLDDVAVALRGLVPIAPTPGLVNVLWVISHPDEVDPRELEGYDLVCAASPSWSAEMSARTGREVVPLLQASEFRPPSQGVADRGRPGVVFVGNAGTRRDRPLVRTAIEAGVPLAVYGRGWEGLPDGIWRAEYVANHRLPELYHQHGVVLADHWPDMARHGFVANRVFDAVASGAHVICDEVAGLRDVFDARDVSVARTAAELATAFEDFAGSGPGDGARPELSFEDRARTLLDRVLAL